MTTNSIAPSDTSSNVIVTDLTFSRCVLEPLSEIEIEEIDHEISHYPRRQAATIEALKIVQTHNRWVSDGKVMAIAEHLGVHASEVESVATFYNRIYRKPVAENVFLICNSVSCWLMGEPELMKTAEEHLNISAGGTSETHKVTLIPTPCLGACDKAPVMTVNDELIGFLNKENLIALIESLNTSGEALA